MNIKNITSYNEEMKEYLNVVNQIYILLSNDDKSLKKNYEMVDENTYKLKEYVEEYRIEEYEKEILSIFLAGLYLEKDYAMSFIKEGVTFEKMIEVILFGYEYDGLKNCEFKLRGEHHIDNCVYIIRNEICKDKEEKILLSLNNIKSVFLFEYIIDEASEIIFDYVLLCIEENKDYSQVIINVLRDLRTMNTNGIKEVSNLYNLDYSFDNAVTLEILDGNEDDTVIKSNVLQFRKK